MVIIQLTPNGWYTCRINNGINKIRIRLIFPQNPVPWWQIKARYVYITPRYVSVAFELRITPFPKHVDHINVSQISIECQFPEW